MKKRYVLPGLVVAALMLGGCGSATTSGEPETTAQAKTESAAKPKAGLTLEEAQEKVKFSIVMPDQLPHDLAFDHASLANGGVVLNFSGPDQKTSLSVMQFQGKELPKLSPNEKELTVSGHKGSFVAEKGVSAISWTDGKLIYHLMAASDSAIGKEEALVEIGAAFARKM